MERTLVLIKPDALHRELAGEIMTRIERKGLKVVALKMLSMSDALLKDHYSHIADKPFFGEISDFMKSTPIIALVVEGVDAVQTVRDLTGATLARQAEVGTIRGDFAMSVQCNLVHSSDSIETAGQEVERFFRADEIFSYPKVTDRVIYNSNESGQ